jgi:3-oxoacyl-[acyl-carrier protein] reductase
VFGLTEFSNRVAVVTGGAGGIGLATVRQFLSAGAAVAIWDVRGEDPADRLSETWQSDRVHRFVVDVRDAALVRKTADEVVRKLGRIDVLINNAGVNIGRRATAEIDEDAWRLVLDTNLAGTVNCVQAVIPHMTKGGWGRIVNVSSILAAYGHPGHAPYVASKSAIAGLTRTWARELGPLGITVNAVSPGYINTAMNETTPAGVVEQVVSATPLGRIGEPDDVARVFLWLSSDGAAFVTGAVIPVDGGLIL